MLDSAFVSHLEVFPSTEQPSPPAEGYSPPMFFSPFISLIHQLPPARVLVMSWVRLFQVYRQYRSVQYIFC